MAKEIEVECPNCTDPMIVTPEMLGQVYVSCENCAAQIDVELLKEAVKKKLESEMK